MLMRRFVFIARSYWNHRPFRETWLLARGPFFGFVGIVLCLLFNIRSFLVLSIFIGGMGYLAHSGLAACQELDWHRD